MSDFLVSLSKGSDTKFVSPTKSQPSKKAWRPQANKCITSGGNNGKFSSWADSWICGENTILHESQFCRKKHSSNSAC